MLQRICALLGIRPTPPSLKDGLIYLERGTTVPTDGAAGYGVGCLFQKTNGAEGTAVYVNEGTATSADFNALATLTVAQEALLSAVAGTVTASKAVIVDASKNASAFGDVGVVNLDAGSSGVAGTVDVFPTTASKGKLAIAVADQVGDTTVALTIAAMAAARAISLPDPLAAADLLLGKQAAVARTATADGLTTAIVADGGKLQHVTVTSGNAGHFVTLPTPTPGTIVILHETTNGWKLRSSTPASIGINGGTGASASSTVAAAKTVIAICVTATSWKAFGLASDGTVAALAAAA